MQSAVEYIVGTFAMHLSTTPSAIVPSAPSCTRIGSARSRDDSRAVNLAPVERNSLLKGLTFEGRAHLGVEVKEEVMRVPRDKFALEAVDGAGAD